MSLRSKVEGYQFYATFNSYLVEILHTIMSIISSSTNSCVEHRSSGMISQKEYGMAKIHKKRSSHLEEAAVSGYKLTLRISYCCLFSPPSNCNVYILTKNNFLFQLCCIDHGIAGADEIEKLKTFDSVYLEF